MNAPRAVGLCAAILLILVASGCITPSYQLPHMIADSITVNISGDNVLLQTTSGPKHRLNFQKPGDSFTIPRNEPFEIVYENVDIANTMLVITGSEDQNTVTLTLQDKFKPVRLTQKCQYVDLLGIDKIPPIEAVDNHNFKQQVIITPIVSQDCAAIMGYEIRYGSIQQGCTATARRVELLSRCRGDRTKLNTRNVYNIDRLVKLLFNL
jgi:hypothetical protein